MSNNPVNVCEKCSKVFNKPLGVISPVNIGGKPLDPVFLCEKCMDEWFKVYHECCDRLSFIEKFIRPEKWFSVWKGFLSGELVSKEKVEFT